MVGPADRLSLLGKYLPPTVELRLVCLAPGHACPYRETDWRDALVVIELGELELECLSGTRWRFAPGDVLWLSGLPLRALHNHGPEPTLLVAVSRRRPMSFRAICSLNSDRLKFPTKRRSRT
jgi:hypothetical protein